jgi:NAD(P)-dependent dehydrogenase (short-subunit alcohol dehydrogenase family)
MDAQGKVWVVTGGGDGIGRELVWVLLQRGARVAAVDMRQDALDTTAAIANAGQRLSTHQLDITDRAGVEALVGDVIDAHGAVDGVINNAGIIQPFKTVDDLDYEVIDRVFNVNFMGALYMTKAFLPTLLKRPAAHLANVSSMGGFFPFPGQTIYGASKAAVKLFTEGLYAELLDTPVAVSLVLPGAVTTNITEHSGVTMSDVGQASKLPQTSADKAARIIIDGLAHDRFHIFVGMDAKVMNAAIKVAPRLATKLIRDQMIDLLQ